MTAPASLMRIAMTDSTFHTLLIHEGILAVRGPDTVKFLQGQLTCNLNYLSNEVSSLGGRCNIKGRLISSFRILLQGDGLLMAMARELLEPQLADLKKYSVFSKVTLSDESSVWTRFGLRDAEPVLQALGLAVPTETDQVSRHAGLIAVALDQNRVELWIPVEQLEAVRRQLHEQASEAPLNNWLLGQVRSGIGQVFGATRELFIPQMINLQAVGGVSFKKGCYTGQEVVARTQYLGRLKRRLYRLSLTVRAAPVPGSKLFSPVHASSVGEVVLAARAEDTIELLAVLQEDAVADGRITFGANDDPPLILLDLPYTLDGDREIQR